MVQLFSFLEPRKLCVGITYSLLVHDQYFSHSVIAKVCKTLYCPRPRTMRCVFGPQVVYSIVCTSKEGRRMLIFTLILYDLHKNGLMILDSTIVVYIHNTGRSILENTKGMYNTLQNIKQKFMYILIVPTYILIKKYEIG